MLDNNLGGKKRISKIKQKTVNNNTDCRTSRVRREVKHDVYGKRQDEISFLPEHGETQLI